MGRADPPDRVTGVAASELSSGRQVLVGTVVRELGEQSPIHRGILLGSVAESYRSGRRTQRVGPLILRLLRSLPVKPGLIVVHGHGRLHPEGRGLACYVGRELQKKCLGVALNPLLNNQVKVGSGAGSSTTITDRSGESVGVALRSLAGGQPIYLSVGYGVETATLVDLVKPWLTEQERLPEPVGQARRFVRRIRRQFTVLAEGLSEAREAYLVGGAWRRLLSGQVPEDYDVVVDRLTSGAKDRLARELGGRWIELDAERRHWRLTTSPVVDVKELRDTQIRQDLGRRDFTVNSIAFDLKREQFVDPHGGREDLRNGCLNEVGPDALERDPIRILRAVRFHLEGGFCLSSALRERLSFLSPRLNDVARERVIQELFNLLEDQCPDNYLTVLEELNILDNGPLKLQEPSVHRGLWRLRNPITERIWSEPVHGGFSVPTGLRLKSLLQSTRSGSWPLNRQLKQRYGMVLDGFHEQRVDRLGGTDELKGCAIGRAIRSGWSTDRLQTAIQRLDDFLTLRHQLEKEIVGELKRSEPDHIDDRKPELLRERLPGRLREAGLEDLEWLVDQVSDGS